MSTASGAGVASAAPSSREADDRRAQNKTFPHAAALFGNDPRTNHETAHAQNNQENQTVGAEDFARGNNDLRERGKMSAEPGENGLKARNKKHEEENQNGEREHEQNGGIEKRG